MSEYVYPGFRPFADKAADDHKIPDADRHRVGSGPFVRDVESGLSQLPGQADRERRMLNPEGSTQDAINRVKATREVLAAQLEAIDDAIDEVLGGIGLGPRTVVLKDEPKPKRTRRPRARPEPAPPAEEEAPEEAESEAQEQEEEASEDDQDPEDEREDAESAD